MTVTAVVVTYNRKEQLRICLAGLLAQEHELTRVIVVDNASTDGTLTDPALQHLFEDSRVRTMSLSSNTGGAGGFRAGMLAALDTDATWIWVMDDDVSPESDCLAKLLEFTDSSECLHPRRVAPDGRTYDWEVVIDPTTGSRTLLPSTSFANGKTLSQTNVACFEGMLVSRRVLESVGPPAAEYFISDDDTLFGIKASVHTNVVVVRDAVLRRQLSPAPMSAFKAYYHLRNRAWLVHDATRYLGLRPSPLERCVLVLSQAGEFVRLARRGPSFWVPAARGFRDGWRRPSPLPTAA